MRTTQKETRFEHQSAILVVDEREVGSGLAGSAKVQVSIFKRSETRDGTDSRWRGTLAEVGDLREALRELDVLLHPERAPTLDPAAPTLNGAEPPPSCLWRAGDCQRTVRHLVTLRGSFLMNKGPEDTDVPMCDRCAAIFDPALGATSGYVRDFRDFVSRRAAPVTSPLEGILAEPPDPRDGEFLVQLTMTQFCDLLAEANYLLGTTAEPFETAPHALRLARLVTDVFGKNRAGPDLETGVHPDFVASSLRGG